jgi:predicted ATP-dependent endonuclease of OLD family
VKINRVKISSILGIDELEFEAGQFNEIAGQNGQGKTSVLSAIKAATQGGHDATLLRKGADKGEIVLLLDDGTEISKRVTESASPLTVTQDGKKVQRPTDVLKALTDTLSVNPIDFLRAPKKDRVRVLLDTMPIEVDIGKLSKISGIKVTAAPGVEGLAIIDHVRKQIFDDRTGTNRAVKEKDATINQLRLAMPEAPGGVTGSEDELLAKVEAARHVKDAELERIRVKLDGIKAENQTKIDEIRAKAQAEIDAVVAGERDFEGKAAIVRERANQAFSDVTTPINSAIAAIRADRNAAAKREQTQATIELMEKDLADLQADASNQTKALEDIDAYKIELLASLPIPGLEVVDGELFRDGVAFDRLNTAQQVEIAVEIAKLRAGELGICCVDQIEMLDSATFEAFREQLMDSGLQMFVTKVSDGEFEIKTTAQ